MMLFTLITTVLSIIAAFVFAALMTLVPIALLVLIIVLIVKACNKKEKDDEPAGEYREISLEEENKEVVNDEDAYWNDLDAALNKMYGGMTKVKTSTKEETISEVLDTFTDEQKQVIDSIVKGG
mgnify:CR=1 FL=1